MTTAIPETSSDSLRQRSAAKPPNDNSTVPADKRAAASAKKANATGISTIDVFRIITGIALVAVLSSYLVTGGKSFTWGLRERRPWWLDWNGVKRAWSGPLTLTPTDLATYDGSTPSRPIYLAINRTIYDVSASPHVYGPGGMYASLAAKDASRSYITTCFDPRDDLVPYLTGVEEVYVPLWLSRSPGVEELAAPFAPEGGVGAGAAAEAVAGKSVGEMIGEVKAKVGKARVKRLQEEAYERARERVRAQIATWEGMFERKAYPKVGTVVEVDERDGKWKKLGFCEAARKQRPPMGESLAEAMRDMGLAGASYSAGAGSGGGGGGAAQAVPEVGKRAEREAAKEARGEKGKGYGKGQDMVKEKAAKEKVKDQKKKQAKGQAGGR